METWRSPSDDPVAAYDRLAPLYDQVSAIRHLYLSGIESLVAARIPRASTSLLDVGGGDGKRTLRIANRAGLKEVVLLEPSAAMCHHSTNLPGIWNIRAEHLAMQAVAVGRRFDVITCLWNVLGHIRPEENRVQTLSELGQRLTARGKLFLDVNHRYNAKSYGWTKTLARLLRDRIRFDERSGDVTVTWNLGETSCTAYGHVFIDREVRELANKSGLLVEEMIVVDYDTGEPRRSSFQGNLFYVLRPDSSASESLRAEHTSSISASVI